MAKSDIIEISTYCLAVFGMGQVGHGHPWGGQVRVVKSSDSEGVVSQCAVGHFQWVDSLYTLLVSG